LVIVVSYLLAIPRSACASAAKTAGRSRLLLGGRTAPWWALAFSIVRDRNFDAHYHRTPAISYAGNLTFLR